MEGDAVAERELPRRVVHLGRQRRGQAGIKLAFRRAGQQRLVDVVVDRPLTAVVDEVRVEAGRLGAERDRDRGALGGAVWLLTCRRSAAVAVSAVASAAAGGTWRSSLAGGCRTGIRVVVVATGGDARIRARRARRAVDDAYAMCSPFGPSTLSG